MARKRDPNIPARPVGRPRRAEQAPAIPSSPPSANKPANWGEFRRYIQEHGDTIIRARFTGAPDDLIETIWSGVPVEEAEKAAYMTADRRWHDF